MILTSRSLIFFLSLLFLTPDQLIEDQIAVCCLLRKPYRLPFLLWLYS